MKLAIVSSYAESCGNAAFTEALKTSIEFETDFSVDVLELNLSFLQSTNRKIRKKGNEHIQELCKKLAGFDLVNIQMEAGLYGTFPGDIIKRSKKLINANPNTVVTLHSPRLITPGHDTRDIVKDFLRLRFLSGIRKLSDSSREIIHIHINKEIIKHATKRKCRLIVHTLRAKRQIGVLFNYANIDVHPLKIVPDSFRPKPEFREKICKDLNLGKSDLLIGMFGYISAYKGHMDAIEAIAKLPRDFKLLIFGRQHPQTLKSTGKVDDYLGSLVEKTKINRLGTKPEQKARVFFLGELSDEDFFQAAANVDVAWLPYYENGQDGSGIASICFDACPRVLCSTSFAFDELFKLEKHENVMRFDIGNYLEMAEKTKIILRNPTKTETPGAYTLSTQAKLYTKLSKDAMSC